MITAEVDGEGLTEAEVTYFFAILMFAGNDTTRNTASGGMRALIENPGERQKLVDNPEGIPNAVEEMLRWVTPVTYFTRIAQCDTEVGGHPIREGERVAMWYAAGSRDPEVNDDPERFDVSRAEAATSGIRRRRGTLLPRQPPCPARIADPVRRADAADARHAVRGPSHPLDVELLERTHVDPSHFHTWETRRRQRHGRRRRPVMTVPRTQDRMWHDVGLPPETVVIRSEVRRAVDGACRPVRARNRPTGRERR